MKRFFSLTALLIILSSCFFKNGNDFIIINEIKLKKNVKIAIIKSKSMELNLVQFTGNQHVLILMKRQLEKNASYELDNLQTKGNTTIVELFLRQEGVNSAMGFLFSSDSNKNFKYIGISDIDSNAESIEKIEIDLINNKINVSLFSSSPKRHFTSTDSCHSWQLSNK